MNKDKKIYYKEINKLFPMHRKKEKEYLNELKTLINEFEEENTNATYKDFTDEFGVPMEIVTSYYQTLDAKELIKFANKKTIIKITCAALLTICILLIGWRYYFYYQAYQDYQNALPVFKDSTVEIVK